MVTDDWWLDVLESCWQQWEQRWNFPVWKMVPENAHRGELLAWQALQKNWQEEAEFRPITQLTRPEIVLKFIDSHPGLSDVCTKFPNYLLDYAPQLAIPGLGGRWEPLFDGYWPSRWPNHLARRQNNFKQGSALTTDQRTPACENRIGA